jgi:hypothetical protein
VEKAKFGARKEVLEATFDGIDTNLVPGAASSTGDDEEFVLLLKPFIGMSMPAEKQSSFVESKKRVNKMSLDFLAWTNHPAVGERRFMGADKNEINLPLLSESLKLIRIQLRLPLDLFFG